MTKEEAIREAQACIYNGEALEMIIDALEGKVKPEVVYRTEYIIEPSQFLRKDDAEKLRAEFIEGLRTGTAVAWPSYKVQAHQQPLCVIMPDGKIIHWEDFHV